MRRLLHVPSADWSALQSISTLRSSSQHGSVEAFEATAGQMLGGRVIAFGSARAALAVIVGILAKPGSRVFVPSFTCVAVPNAVQTGGGVISWVDIEGPNIDVERVASIGRPGDVVVAQHTYGVPVEASAMAMLRDRGMLVIEDRAHRFDGDGVVGHAVVFSLEHSKVVSGGQGGLARIDDDAIFQRIVHARDRLIPVKDSTARRILRTSVSQRLLASPRVPNWISGLGRRAALRVPALSEPGQTREELDGGTVRLRSLHPLLAAAGHLAVSRAPQNLAHRAWAARRYAEGLGDFVPAWALPIRPYVRMPIVVHDASVVTLVLRRGGIDLGPRWFESPVHPAGSRSTYRVGSAPRAEALAKRVLSLPTHPLVTSHDIDEIVTRIKATMG